MGGKQSTRKGNIQDVLTFFEEEIKKWNDHIKTLKESWKKTDDRNWVQEYLIREMDETETRWINIRSSIHLEDDGNNYTGNAPNIPPCCQEREGRLQSELEQMKQSNEEVLKNLKEAEGKINEQNGTIEKLQSKFSTSGGEVGIIKEEETTQSVYEPPQERSKQSEDSVRMAKGGAQETKDKSYKDLAKENKELTAKCERLEKENDKHKEHEVKQSKKGKKRKDDQEIGNNLQKQNKDMIDQFNEEKLKLVEEIDSTKAKNISLESELQTKEKENESLSLRLSKVASEKLMKDNSAITDLSDPNRPMKIGEVYSELYDNQWTDAFDALKEAGHEELKAIETLTLTLKHVLEFCKTKAELLLKRSSDVNLLFEVERTSENDPKIPSIATMQPKQAKKVAQMIRQNTMEEIKFQQDRWMAKTDFKPENVQQNVENVWKGDESKLDIESKFKQLRKEMATYMVPIVLKAYMEINWSNRYIDGLKPFISECILVSWMMVVQSPPMAIHTCNSGTKFDKNFYKEYTATGSKVKYMVWPALLLEKDGALICKGIAEGEKSPN